MKIQLTWKLTKDVLLFDVINQHVAVWFIQTSQQSGNHYSVGDQVIDTIKKV